MATLILEQQLAQKRENSTNAVSVYSPPANTTVVIKNVTVCNQTGSAATFRIFIDDNGTTYDENTALYFDEAIAANTTREINTFWAMNNADGNLAYRSGTANAVTITVFGAEIS
jgi:hypothetical protein|tara:strand:+ start:295 stop:636 length:342 start_codon:yes stop_codon:yes gene_type:complete